MKKVTKKFPPNTIALEEVDIHIKPGEFVSIVGRSGCGKTTVCKLILLLEPFQSK